MSEERVIGLALIGYFHEASRALIAHFASKNPELWTTAELDDMYRKFEEISLKVSGAKGKWDDEQTKADAIEKLYNQRLKAVEILNQQFEDTADPALKESYRKSREAQMAVVEGMLPDVEHEKQLAASFKQLYEETTTFCISFRDQLVKTREAIQQATRDMEMAKIQTANAEMREKVAKEAAGLQAHGGNLNVVLGAMQGVAAKERQKAEAANLRADLLHHTDLEMEDPLVKAAMEKAAGHVPAAEESFADRLARLKGTAPAAA